MDPVKAFVPDSQSLTDCATFDAGPIRARPVAATSTG